jgi:hypothetical protein
MFSRRLRVLLCDTVGIGRQDKVWSLEIGI